MLERKKLNKLVILTLSRSEIPPKASQSYEQIKEAKPLLLRQESVRGFRSFIKILNSFEQIEQRGCGVKQYSIKKEFILCK